MLRLAGVITEGGATSAGQSATHRPRYILLIVSGGSQGPLGESSMCGRYALDVTGSELAQVFGSMLGTGVDFQPRLNIAPTMEAPVLRGFKGASMRLDLLRWGLIPSWSTDAGVGGRLINARSETVFEKPAFKAAVRDRRCLVPARLFYEWKRLGRSRVPFGIRPSDDSFFAFAGIWERWEGKDQSLQTVAILTTSPNTIMAPIHDRRPVSLDHHARRRWLDHRKTADGGPSEIELRSFLTPVASDLLQVHRVSPQVNDARHEGPGLMDPIDATMDDSEPPGLFG